MAKKSILLFAAVLGVIINSSVAFAETDVFYAGFAYSGKFSDIESNFKYTAMFNKPNAEDRTYLNQLFGDFFKDNNVFNEINLKIGEMSKRNDSPVVMAITVIREGVAIDEFSDFFKIVGNLFCNVVFMDFKEKRIVSSYPVFVEYVDAAKERPSDAYLAEMIKKMYSSEEFGIIASIKQRMNSFRAENSSILAAQIENIEISLNAQEMLETNADGIERLKSFMVYKYSSVLSSDLGISVLPPYRDCLTGKMSLVFSDATEQNFLIPEPAYSVDMSVTDLKTKILKETPSQIGYAFGGYIHIKVYEKKFNKVFFDKEVKHGASKNVPSSQKGGDKKEIFTDVLGGAMQKSIDEMRNNDETNKTFIRLCQNS